MCLYNTEYRAKRVKMINFKNNRYYVLGVVVISFKLSASRLLNKSLNKFPKNINQTGILFSEYNFFFISNNNISIKISPHKLLVG